MFGSSVRWINSRCYLLSAVLLLGTMLSCTGSGTITGESLEGTSGTAPSATLQSYNATGTAPLTVGLDASASSATAGIKSFDYDFDGDGTYDELGGEDNTSHLYTTPGSYTAWVRVTALDGGIATASAKVEVTGDQGADPANPQDPDADLAIYPSASVTGTAVVIDASNSKPNMAGTLTYDYDLDGDGDYDRRDAGSNFEYTYDEVGTYNVRVRVTNEGDRTDTATATVRIDAPQGGGGGGGEEVDPPFVKLGYWPEAVKTGEEVNFDASNSWARDNSTLGYEYDFDGDGSYDLQTAENGVIHVYNTAGTYRPVVRVTDGGGRQSTSTVTVVVTQAPPNQAPSALLSADPSVGEAALEVAFDASLSYDNDGTITSYMWTFGDNPGAAAVSGNATASHTYTAAGIYTATVTVRDNDGAEASANAVITVQQPLGNVLGPEAKLSAVPLAGEVPLTVNFDAGASSDPNGTIIEYRFDFDGDGTFDLLSLDPAQSYTYTADGTYNATVTVEDNDGLTDSASVSITVGSGGGGGGGFAPVVVISNTPSFGSAPLSVSFSTEYSLDIDGEIVRFDWDLNNDGTFEIIGGGQSQSVMFQDPGTYLVNVRATDNDGNTATGLGMIYLD